MKCYMRSAAFLALLMLGPRAWAQSPPVVKIDPASEHSRVYLSFLDATTQNKVAGKFDFEAPRHQDYKPFALLLTNASGKAIVQLTIRWMAVSADRTVYYDSLFECLLPMVPGMSSGCPIPRRLPGQSLPVPPPLPIGQGWARAGKTEVANNGERMIVAPGLFIRESNGTWGLSTMSTLLQKAETVSAILDTVVLQDGEVLGPDASCTLNSLRERKAIIDALLNAIKTGEQNGMDSVEILKYMANERVPGPDNDPGFHQLHNLANLLMLSSDWKHRLEEWSAIQLPNFHR